MSLPSPSDCKLGFYDGSGRYIGTAPDMTGVFLNDANKSVLKDNKGKSLLQVLDDYATTALSKGVSSKSKATRRRAFEPKSGDSDVVMTKKGGVMQSWRIKKPRNR